jgi:hypothetical protein
MLKCSRTGKSKESGGLPETFQNPCLTSRSLSISLQHGPRRTATSRGENRISTEVGRARRLDQN